MQVTACTTEESLAAASVLFDAYRRHYGQSASAGDSHSWLTSVVGSGALTVFTAAPSPGSAPVGLATAHALPASLALGWSCQLRDLYVDPASRRLGVAAALLAAVRDAAVAAGAVRLSLVTEPDNAPALALYTALGFRPVEGLTTLSLDLRR